MGKFCAAWALTRRSFRALAGVDAEQFGQMAERLTLPRKRGRRLRQ